MLSLWSFSGLEVVAGYEKIKTRVNLESRKTQRRSNHVVAHL